VVEIASFVDGTGRTAYRVRTDANKQFLLSPPLAEILRAMQGNEEPAEICKTLSRDSNLEVTPETLETTIEAHLVPRGLVAASGARAPSPEPGPKRRKPRAFDFVLRIPLLPPRLVVPLATPLKSLFRLPIVQAGLLVSLLAHLRFYMLPVTERALAPTREALLMAYAIVFAVVFFHEIGHATASRLFGCEHGEIGFCLYLIFPAFYVDLSPAWRLQPRQRAVIDAAGVYFQLLAVPLLYLVHVLTGSSACASAIYAIDMMAVMTVNPLFKCDGYWLLVDLSNFPNLQPRALSLLREVVQWPIRKKRPEGIANTSGIWRKGLLLVYSSTIAAGIMWALPRLLLSFPDQASNVWRAGEEVVSTLFHDPGRATLALGAMLTPLFFFVFVLQAARLLVSLLRQRPDVALPRKAA
jgi:putative peptide zinc metalloprotease protein